VDTWVGATQDLCLLVSMVIFEQNIQKDKDTKTRDIYQHNADRGLCSFILMLNTTVMLLCHITFN
jgi:hypothetical protein